MNYHTFPNDSSSGSQTTNSWLRQLPCSAGTGAQVGSGARGQQRSINAGHVDIYLDILCMDKHLKIHTCLYMFHIQSALAQHMYIHV